nr:hypothetical protein CFP56_05092 [Quercus suber]
MVSADPIFNTSVESPGTISTSCSVSDAHFPSWRNLLLRSYLACWLESLILLHFGFQLFADVLHFGIPLSFTALHFGELALPYSLGGPEFVAVAQLLAVV